MVCTRTHSKLWINIPAAPATRCCLLGSLLFSRTAWQSGLPMWDAALLDAGMLFLDVLAATSCACAHGLWLGTQAPLPSGVFQGTWICQGTWTCPPNSPLPPSLQDVCSVLSKCRRSSSQGPLTSQAVPPVAVPPVAVQQGARRAAGLAHPPMPSAPPALPPDTLSAAIPIRSTRRWGIDLHGAIHRILQGLQLATHLLQPAASH